MTLLQLALIALSGLLALASAQDELLLAGVKGGSVSVKGGGAVSKFRQSIATIQQQALDLQQQNLLSIQQNSTTSNQLVQRPAAVQQSIQSGRQTISSNNQLVQVEEQVAINNNNNNVVTSQEQQIWTDSEPSQFGSVQGSPGIDFPNYRLIPNTGFSCANVPFDPGMYADEATGCQVYHLCYMGRKESFLCGIGTVFNQAILNCDYWHSVECSSSSRYYGLNSEFGKGSPEPGGLQKVSNSFLSRQQAINFPVVNSKTNLISSKKSIVTTQSLPKLLVEDFRRTESFASDGKVSAPKQSSFDLVVQRQSNLQQQQQLQQSGVKGASVLQTNRRFYQVGGIDALPENQIESQFASGSTIHMAAAASGSPSSAGHSKSSWNLSQAKQGGKGLNRIVDSDGARSQQPQFTAVVKSNNGEQGEWRPYFKSSTAAPGSAGDQNRPPAESQADQEPIFSTNSASSGAGGAVSTSNNNVQVSNGAGELAAEAPRPPPATGAPVSSTESPIEAPVIEPDVGSALGSTSQTPSEASSEPASSAPESPGATSASPTASPTVGENQVEAAERVGTTSTTTTTLAPTGDSSTVATSSSSVEYATEGGSSQSPTSAAGVVSADANSETATTSADKAETEEGAGAAGRARRRKKRRNPKRTEKRAA